MEPGTLIRRTATQTWRDYQATGGTLRGQPGALALREMLEDIAERCFQISVLLDKALLETNIEGQLDRENGAIYLRPDLGLFRTLFVLAHELGHRALDHPLHLYSDTSAEIDFEVSPESLSAVREERLTGGAMTATAVTLLRGYSPQEFTELQANAYAAELLVPGAWLREAFAAAPHLSTLSAAEKLGVPERLVYFGMSRSLLKSTHPWEVEEESEAIRDESATASDSLDTEQRHAVNCTAPVLVIAGPGTGKTKALVARYAWHLQKGLKPDQVLPLTFANKAAGEMRERIAALLSPDQGGQIAVFTFHALGLQLLQQYGAHLGLKLPLQLITPLDALLLFRRHAARMSLGSLSDLPKSLENLQNMLKAVARSKDENAGPERWYELVEQWEKSNIGISHAERPLWAKDGPRFYQEYQKTLRKFQLLDYGDLLMLSLRLFEIPEVATEIRSQYQAILVDETQDINYVSGLLVRALDGGRDVVWAVGDPRQSIYGFRGASPINLLHFKSEEYYPNTKIVWLTTNYRSVPDVVAAGAAVAIPFPSDSPLLPPPLKASRSPENDKPAVTSIHFPDGGQEMRWLAAEINRLREGATQLSSIAVLTRTRSHAGQVAQALTAAGVTHRWSGPLEERSIFRLLMSALLLVADETAGIAGLTTISPGANLPPDVFLSEPDRRFLFAGGQGRQKARSLLSSAAAGNVPGLSEEGVVACRTLLEIIGPLKASARPFHNLTLYLFGRPDNWFRRLLTETARSEPEVQVILAAIGRTLDLASDFSAQRDNLARAVGLPYEEDPKQEPILVDTDVTTSAFIDYLRSALDADALEVPHELDMNAEAVWILTAHRSKGLEWPVVFVPFCSQKEFPSAEKPDKVPLPPGIIVGEEDVSERHHRDEACLFYVAVTRARNQLYLSGADRYSRNVGKSALRAGVEEQLARLGRIRLPEITIPSVIEETQQEQIWVPYQLPEVIHEQDLETYKVCPRQFLYKHIYGLPDSDTAYLRYHRAIYGALQDAQQEPERVREFFDKRWNENGPPKNHWRNPLFLEDATRRIQQAAASITNNEERLFRIEKQFPLAPTESGKSYSLRFVVDEERRKVGGETILLRHKQGTRLPKEAPDEDRMTLYALYAEQQPETTVAYYYPRLDREIRPSVGKVKKKNYQVKRLQIIASIESGKFPANPKACKECPYLLACEGR